MNEKRMAVICERDYHLSFIFMEFSLAQENKEALLKAKKALNKLTRDLSNHPDVRLIDMGFDRDQNKGMSEIVLRIHLSKSADRTRFPKEVDGIPVKIIFTDYELQG